MGKTYKITLGLLVLLLTLLTYLEANEPQELNWSPSYSAADKIPLGSHVLYESLKDQNFPLEAVNIPPFEFLNDSAANGTYFFLNDQLAFDKSELKKLLQWIEKGNSAFLIAEHFSQNILDTLELEIEVAVPKNGISSKPLLNLSSEELKREEPFLLDRETYLRHFTEIDSANQEVLGISQLRQDNPKIQSPEINFLRDSIGKGTIYLNSTPWAFSNYFLLEENNSEYAERALAYIPTEKTLFWDQYYKSGKAFTTSPLFVILNSKPLKWAYYFIIIGSVFFVIFEGRRKQRSIPVVEPLRNQTYHFTRTISGLYLDRNDYKNISTKKIALFLEHVRSNYRVNTHEKGEHFYNRLASLSNNPVEEVKELWHFMEELDKKNQVSKNELLNLNKAINTFKRRKNGK